MSDPDEPSARAKQREGSNTSTFSILVGNPLFEAAVEAIGFDAVVTRLMLSSVLKTLGLAPDELTPDDLGILLPEIDRRLRQLAPDENVEAASKRLQHVLLSWDERA